MKQIEQREKKISHMSLEELEDYVFGLDLYYPDSVHQRGKDVIQIVMEGKRLRQQQYKRKT